MTQESNTDQDRVQASRAAAANRRTAAADRELRQWAVERAIESTPSRGVGTSPAQRRKDIIAAAKDFEAYVTGGGEA